MAGRNEMFNNPIMEKAETPVVAGASEITTRKRTAPQQSLGRSKRRRFERIDSDELPPTEHLHNCSSFILKYGCLQRYFTQLC